MMSFRNWIVLSALLITGINHSAFAEHGGISGGGGGTSNPIPATADQIKQAIVDSKLILTLYFNDRSRVPYWTGKTEADRSPIDQKLFSNSKTVFDALDLISAIQIKENEACLYQGKPVDGSANSIYANPICISVYALSKKLTEYNYSYEVSALIAHELAHLMGATEEEAVSVQVDVIRALLKKQTDLLLKRLHGQHNRTIRGMYNIYGWIQEYGKVYNTTLNKNCQTIKKLHSFLNDSWRDYVEILGENFSIFNFPTLKTTESVFAKIDALSLAACGSAFFSLEAREIKARYEKLFKNQSSLNSCEYMKREAVGSKPECDENVFIEKVTNEYWAQSELSQIKLQLEALWRTNLEKLLRTKFDLAK